MLLTFSAASLLAQSPETLRSIAVDDATIVRRWALDGDPHGLAVGADGTLYVGLAQPQAVLAIDSKSGAIRRRVVLDSEEIASTKELVTLRTNRAGTRLYIANGSDESATILSLPDLGVVREITMEGEAIRDALPDPRGRYLFLLGRRVHVFDANGDKELHTLDVANPSAIAANGKTLAVMGDELVFFDASTLAESFRAPLRHRIESAVFAGDTLVAVTRDTLLAIDSSGVKVIARTCLPVGSGAQIAAVAANELLLFPQSVCSEARLIAHERIKPAALTGVNAYAVAYDRSANTLIATDRAGYLTIYKVPRTKK